MVVMVMMMVVRVWRAWREVQLALYKQAVQRAAQAAVQATVYKPAVYKQTVQSPWHSIIQSCYNCVMCFNHDWHVHIVYCVYTTWHTK